MVVGSQDEVLGSLNDVVEIRVGGLGLGCVEKNLLAGRNVDQILRKYLQFGLTSAN